ncbi:MAG: hypothetical protein ACR2FJ_01735 [Qipengyuania sp.]
MRIDLLISAALVLGLSACQAPAEDADSGAEGETAQETPAVSATDLAMGAASAGKAETPETEEPPGEFVRTAWRVLGENGARYTTYLDEDGTYRDLKNGELWQTGSWSFGEDEKLCLTPEDENGATRCWDPLRMEGKDALIVVSDADRRVRLEKVDYRIPDED